MLQTKLMIGGSFLESVKNVLIPKGYFERYHVAVLQALISLDQLRTLAFILSVVFLNGSIVF